MGGCINRNMYVYLYVYVCVYVSRWMGGWVDASIETCMCVCMCQCLHVDVARYNVPTFVNVCLYIFIIMSESARGRFMRAHFLRFCVHTLTTNKLHSRS